MGARAAVTCINFVATLMERGVVLCKRSHTRASPDHHLETAKRLMARSHLHGVGVQFYPLHLENACGQFPCAGLYFYKRLSMFFLLLQTPICSDTILSLEALYLLRLKVPVQSGQGPVKLLHGGPST